MLFSGSVHLGAPDLKRKVFKDFKNFSLSSECAPSVEFIDSLFSAGRSLTAGSLTVHTGFLSSLIEGLTMLNRRTTGSLFGKNVSNGIAGLGRCFSGDSNSDKSEPLSDSTSSGVSSTSSGSLFSDDRSLQYIDNSSSRSSDVPSLPI